MGNRQSKVRGPSTQAIKEIRNSLENKKPLAFEERPLNDIKDDMANDPQLRSHLQKLASSISSKILTESTERQKEYRQALIYHNQLNRDFTQRQGMKSIIPVESFPDIIRLINQGKLDEIKSRFGLEESTLKSLCRLFTVQHKN
jgi:hypothetical protein